MSQNFQFIKVNFVVRQLLPFFINKSHAEIEEDIWKNKQLPTSTKTIDVLGKFLNEAEVYN